MQKTIGLLLICLVFTTTAWATDVIGVVRTAKGKPIYDAVVLHRDSGKKTFSDEQGIFRLFLPDSERIILEIIHPDYIEQEISIGKNDFKKKLIVTLSPYIRQQEEVVVTALRYPESSATVPAAETVVTEENLEEKITPNIAQVLLDLPGVSNIGAGGFSLVPNIRGLARRRVLILIDNARVTSDRRTGPSASFVSPKDIRTIEVLRSPSSVFYGSDAIGGVVHIMTKEAPLSDTIGGTLSAKFGTINQEKGLGFSLEGKKKRSSCPNLHKEAFLERSLIIRKNGRSILASWGLVEKMSVNQIRTVKLILPGIPWNHRILFSSSGWKKILVALEISIFKLG
jgi:hypothetical protein